jgi:hypothetical protein
MWRHAPSLATACPHRNERMFAGCDPTPLAATLQPGSRTIAPSARVCGEGRSPQGQPSGLASASDWHVEPMCRHAASPAIRTRRDRLTVAVRRRLPSAAAPAAAATPTYRPHVSSEPALHTCVTGCDGVRHRGCDGALRVEWSRHGLTQVRGTRLTGFLLKTY